MNIAIGIVLFFLSLIALVVEFFIYFAVVTGDAMNAEMMKTEANSNGIAGFFVWLMITTCAIGLFAPIGGIIEQFSKKKNLGWGIFLILTAIVSGFFGLMFLLMAYKS